MTLPRRMFVGARVQFLRPALIGQALHRHATVTRVESKTGRSGTLVFVTVRYEISAEGETSIVEEQDLVYREAAAGGGPGEPSPPPGEQIIWPWRLQINIDPTVLFRFSALTYNAHRIHYDREWATQTEGYPGLVVHGPLQAVAMAEVCRREGPTWELQEFEFRGRATRLRQRTTPDSGPAGAEHGNRVAGRARRRRRRDRYGTGPLSAMS